MRRKADGAAALGGSALGGTAPGYDPASVPTNARGGVAVSDEELRAAFEFFDVEASGKITVANLRKRLGVFYKNMPAKEFRFLLNNKPEMSLDDLRDLLVNNEVRRAASQVAPPP